MERLLQTRFLSKKLFSFLDLKFYLSFGFTTKRTFSSLQKYSNNNFICFVDDKFLPDCFGKIIKINQESITFNLSKLFVRNYIYPQENLDTELDYTNFQER